MPANDQRHLMHAENQAEIATIKTRMVGVENDVHDIKGALSAIRSEFSSGMSAIHNKLDEKAKTPWPVIFSGLAFVLAFSTTIGTMAYIPIRTDMTRLETTMKERYDEGLARDRRAYDAFYSAQRQLDRLEGSLRPLFPAAPH